MKSRLSPIKAFAKYTALLAIVGFALSSGLAACGKKSGDSNQLNVGSLVSDGNGVTSTSSVGGYQLNFSVQNIQPSQYGGGFGGYMYAQTYTNLMSIVTVNGQQQQLNTSIIMGNSGYNYQPQVSNINSYTVYHQAACYNQACSDIAFAVTFSTGFAAKQVLIRKSMVENKIVKLAEWDTTTSNLRSVFTMMSEVK